MNKDELAAWNKLVDLARQAKRRYDRDQEAPVGFTLGVLAAEGELQHLRLEHALAHKRLPDPEAP